MTIFCPLTRVRDARIDLRAADGNLDRVGPADVDLATAARAGRALRDDGPGAIEDRHDGAVDGDGAALDDADRHLARPAALGDPSAPDRAGHEEISHLRHILEDDDRDRRRGVHVRGSRPSLDLGAIQPDGMSEEDVIRLGRHVAAVVDGHQPPGGCDLRHAGRAVDRGAQDLLTVADHAGIPAAGAAAGVSIRPTGETRLEVPGHSSRVLED